MGTVTYPDPRVIEALNRQFVPVKLESAKHGEVARKMNVRWLPGLVVAGADERPASVQVGFLAPQDLLGELSFGRALVAMGGKDYDQAHQAFREVVEAPGAERAPDAWYWWGISAYRQSKDFADCVERWAEIPRRWPGTPWARRVEYALPAR
jgi:TolA-binding protein